MTDGEIVEIDFTNYAMFWVIIIVVFVLGFAMGWFLK